MGKLSQALKQYYQREGNKIIFRNKYTLNQLALEMWEKLGYQQIDSSVLSRVLKGKRFFTPPQLAVFCELLILGSHEREYLYHCLYLEYFRRYGVKPDILNASSYDIVDVFDSLLHQAYKYLLIGKFEELETLTAILQDHLEKSLSTSPNNNDLKRKLYGQIATNLYYKGRALGSRSLAPRAINEIASFAKQLFNLTKITKNLVHEAYGRILLANAYYVAGNYSETSRSKPFYLRSIHHAKKAFYSIPDSYHEKLFSIRTFVASTVYLNNKLDFINIRNSLMNRLKKIPGNHFVNGIHLYNTVAKGVALFKLSDPRKIKDAVSVHFRATLKDYPIYDVSDTRLDLEIFNILETKNINFLKKRVNNSIQIAQQENYIRHLKSIKKLANKLF